MFTRLMALVFLLPAVVLAEWKEHPFRVVDGQFCDLRPLYDWLNSGFKRTMPNPMPAWKIIQTVEITSPSVRSIKPGGIVVSWAEKQQVFKQGRMQSDQVHVTAFIMNYPTNKARLGARVQLVVRPTKMIYQWSESFGKIQKLPVYNYGIPTNAPAITKPPG